MAPTTSVHERAFSSAVSALATAVSAALATRADELARAWLERVREQLELRPHAGFPGPSLLDLAPVLVRWTVRGGVQDEMPREVEGALRALVMHRLDQDHLLEEVMLEVRILEDVLFEAANDEIEDRGGSSAEGLQVGALLARRISAAMTQAAGVFNEQVEDERRSDRRKLDSFTRTISHEMRTPIGAAFTGARMLEDVGDALPPAERARMLAVVSRGLARATELLESAMALAHARGVDGGDPTRSLREVVEDVVASQTDRAREASVSVEVVGPVPAIDVDARRVGLLLRNLVSNAIRFADRQKSDRWARVRIDRDRDRLGWRVQVSDNGIGIARADQKRVFRRFYRTAGGGHGDLARGTGLGLVIAREAAEQLGSDLTLESVPGVGTTLVFTVPDPENP
jgi:signal transduction histidine kinase